MSPQTASTEPLAPKPAMVQPSTPDDLGPWCTYERAIHSDTAKSLGIPNVPNAAQLANMQVLYDKIYGPLCDHYGFKLPISSFFRSQALNRNIKGASRTSAHMLGQAVDIDCDGIPNLGNDALLAYIRANFIFDQLILEYPDKNGKPSWVHVSYRANGVNRKQVLRARKTLVKQGKKLVETTVYDPI